VSHFVISKGLTRYAKGVRGRVLQRSEGEGIIVNNQASASTQAVEQYKAKLSDLGNLGGRHTSMTTYYISILSALLGLLALKESSATRMDMAVLLVICGAGVLVSVLWFYSLSYFCNLYHAKLKILEGMEETLPHQTFKQEYDMMCHSGIHSWVWIERLVPIVFACMFLALAATRLIRLCPCLQGMH
jgi:hypothetical protein